LQAFTAALALEQRELPVLRAQARPVPARPVPQAPLVQPEPAGRQARPEPEQMALRR